MKSLLFVSFVSLALVIGGCSSSDNPTSPATTPDASVEAQRTFVLSLPSDPRLPLPMVEDQQATDNERAFCAQAQPDMDGPRVDTPPPEVPPMLWNRVTTRLGLAAKLPPPKFSRAYALVHVAIYDALLAAHQTNRHDLLDNAVSAGAATTVLEYLFPSDSASIFEFVRGQLRAPHGLAIGRVVRSWVLGRRVGELVVDHGKLDGSNVPFTGTPPSGDGIWTGTNPVLPTCGDWQTWITTSGGEFQPEPPYPFGSHADSVEVQQVYDVSLHRTPEQIAIVHKWADTPPPTIWNAILNDRITSNSLNTMHAARAYAYLNVAMYDAFVSCWKTKYIYWIARPFQRTPGLVTVITTPNFPSYTSGHSTISGAAAIVMGELFSSEASYFSAQADEAAISRLYGGIHFQHDNDQGLAVGHQIGNKVVGVMQHDGTHALMAIN